MTEEIEDFQSDHVFNCTYASLNQVIHGSSLELIPLKHEMTEMAIVDVPDELKHLGITVMCGPFFSVMPFPSVQMNGHYLHSFSHVRYTPHYEWYSMISSTLTLMMKGLLKMRNIQHGML